ncbi:MAG: ATP-binding protein, partial [Candidatus Omnitrophica bacterium]|nr:ATP-binding protein [Candidatus Omnitrophota bacterium]
MDNKFFGRQEYLDILRKRVSGLKLGYRQNIAMVGDELVGKTSLICNFLNNFYDNEVLIIYLQVRPEAISSFAKRFIGVLFYNFLINSGIPLREDLGFLLAKSEKYIPKATLKARMILGLVETRKKNNIFSELLSLCEIIKQETGKPSVVIFDEFHNLESLGVKNLYPEWSKLLMTQKDIMYIIISSLKFKAKTILSKNLSLLFGNFEVMEIEPFDIKTSEEFLKKQAQGFSLDPGLKNFIVHFTGGYPFYLNLINESLLKTGYSDLGDILEGLLFESSGILNQKFSNYIKRFLDSSHSQQYLSILYQIASGHNKIRDIAHLLRLS